jgi:Flp pilus assembly protein TadG
MKCVEILRQAAGFVSRFREDQHGGMMVFIACLMVPLVIATGLAIDGGRGYLLRARLGDAIDAAGLAATMAVSDGDHFEEDFEQIFYANFPDGFLGAEVTLDPPAISDDEMTITYSASATIGTTFMRVAGIPTLTVSNSAEVTRQTASIDLVISLDMSGSMDNNNRIEGAREAANTLVDILYGEDSFKEYLKIGFVPWNSKVNVTDGSAYSSSTTQAVPGFTNPITGTYQTSIYYANNSAVPLLSQPPANWQGCVYARYSNDGNSSNDADLLLGPISVGGADWPAWQPIGANDEPSPDGTCSSSD